MRIESTEGGYVNGVWLFMDHDLRLTFGGVRIQPRLDYTNASVLRESSHGRTLPVARYVAKGPPLYSACEMVGLGVHVACSTYAGGVTKLDSATLVVRLYLEHPDPIL